MKIFLSTEINGGDMALVNKDALVDTFKNGKRPNEEEDFENLIDSCYGFVEGIAVSSDQKGLVMVSLDINGQFKETPIPRDPQTGPITYDSTQHIMVVGQEGSSQHRNRNEQPGGKVHIAGDIKLQNGPKVGEISEKLDGLASPGNAIPTAQAVTSGTAKLLVFAAMGNHLGAIKTLTEAPEINEKVLDFSKVFYSPSEARRPSPIQWHAFSGPVQWPLSVRIRLRSPKLRYSSGSIALTLNTTTATKGHPSSRRTPYSGR
ncbi:MAG: hypothetical protein U0176_12700 [Bacteroidia bacterium]